MIKKKEEIPGDDKFERVIKQLLNTPPKPRITRKKIKKKAKINNYLCP